MAELEVNAEEMERRRRSTEMQRAESAGDRRRKLNRRGPGGGERYRDHRE